MVEKSKLGCDVCREAVYGLRWKQELDRIADHAQGPAFLCRCRSCKTYWDFELRYAAPISDEDARKLYPQAFEQ